MVAESHITDEFPLLDFDDALQDGHYTPFCAYEAYNMAAGLAQTLFTLRSQLMRVWINYPIRPDAKYSLTRCVSHDTVVSVTTDGYEAYRDLEQAETLAMGVAVQIHDLYEQLQALRKNILVTHAALIQGGDPLRFIADAADVADDSMPWGDGLRAEARALIAKVEGATDD